jgi:hypothetical protein
MRPYLQSAIGASKLLTENSIAMGMRRRFRWQFEDDGKQDQMTDRERFEAWRASRSSALPNPTDFDAWMAATLTERERCAKLCLAKFEQIEAKNSGRHSDYEIGAIDAYDVAERMIRSGE